MDFENYRKAYEEVFAKVGDKDIALFILGQAAKDRRTEEINNTGRKTESQTSDELATSNQISYLKRLGADVRPGLSKAEASKLIDQKTGKK